MVSAPMNADVVLARSGDRAAFARLVAGTRNLVCTIALAELRDVAASEDVAQEVFVVAWRDLPKLREADSFLPWLKQITRHRASNFARGERRARRRVDPVVVDAAHTVLDECLALLPADDRELLVLFYREGQSVAQVALLLELSDSAVKKRLERARGRLREGVREHFADAAARTAPGDALMLAVTLATSPLLGLLAGLGGALLPLALSRQAMKLCAVSGALLVAWFVSFVALLPVTRAPLWLVGPYVLVVLAHLGMYVVWLPRLISWPQQRRRYLWFMAAFVTGAVIGTTTLVTRMP